MPKETHNTQPMTKHEALVAEYCKKLLETNHFKNKKEVQSLK
ncbi:hypothetical protein MSHRCOH1_05905 [Candidatus Ornithobacterium hominis]|nr:hypothetical protein MSHRCOH1_05905 [Candidatus Ornithobacterium hominis]